MKQILIYIIGLVMGGLVVWLFIKRDENKSSSFKSQGFGLAKGETNLDEFNKVREQKANENKAKILAMFSQNQRLKTMMLKNCLECQMPQQKGI